MVKRRGINFSIEKKVKCLMFFVINARVSIIGCLLLLGGGSYINTKQLLTGYIG